MRIWLADRDNHTLRHAQVLVIRSLIEDGLLRPVGNALVDKGYSHCVERYVEVHAGGSHRYWKELEKEAYWLAWAKNFGTKSEGSSQYVDGI